MKTVKNPRFPDADTLVDPTPLSQADIKRISAYYKKKQENKLKLAKGGLLSKPKLKLKRVPV